MSIEAIKYKGFNIIMEQDEYAESPREWDNLGTMLAIYRGYDLGDEKGITADEIIDRVFGSMENYRKGKVLPGVLALPLVLLDHSGLWMRVGSSFHEDPGGWDTSRVGFIYATYEQIKKKMARPGKLSKDGINPELHPIKHITRKDIEHAERVLRAEVEEYSSYLEGAVYGWVVRGLYGEHIESVWGYYGSDGWDRAITEAKECIDSRVDGELYKRRGGEQMELFPITM